MPVYSRVIFVQNLPLYEDSHADLKRKLEEDFKQFGEIESIEISKVGSVNCKLDNKPKDNTSYAYIRYKEKEDAELAVRGCTFKQFEGQECKVTSYKDHPDDNPPIREIIANNEKKD